MQPIQKIKMAEKSFLTEQENEIIKDRIDLAIRWLLDSGIQNKKGYFNAWYDVEKKAHSFIYDEMIGYGTETLLYLYSRENRKEYLNKAKNAMDWLIENMIYDGNDPMAKDAFIWRYDLPNGPFGTKVYTFDAGMCLPALVNLFSITREQKYLDVAVSAADWMINVMQNVNGSFKACYDFRSKTFGNGRWSTMPGSYHSKLSIGLSKLYAITKNRTLRKAVQDLCAWVLTLQQENGRFKTNENSDDTYIHAHCYAVEGLLYASKEFSDKIPENVISAINWVLKIQKINGSVGRWFNSNTALNSDENTESLAQAIRLCLLSASNKNCVGKYLFSHKLKKMVDHLVTLQCLDGDKRMQGGFYYAKLDNKLVPHINCWATLFSIQALQMYLDWNTNNFHRDYYLKWIV